MPSIVKCQWAEDFGCKEEDCSHAVAHLYEQKYCEDDCPWKPLAEAVQWGKNVSCLICEGVGGLDLEVTPVTKLLLHLNAADGV